MRHRYGASDAADSAGVPWEGREFRPNPLAEDDGSEDPRVAAAFLDFRGGRAGPEAVVAAIGATRVLVPLVAEAGALGTTADGRTVDKTQELSIPTVRAPDGRSAMLAFTSVAALTRWDAAARPVPVDATRLALAAGAEDAVVVIDPADRERGFVLRRPALRAVAVGEPWTPPWRDRAVVATVAASIEDETQVLEAALAPGDPTCTLAGPDLLIVLRLAPGLDRERLDALIERLRARWDAAAFDAVDAVGVRITG